MEDIKLEELNKKLVTLMEEYSVTNASWCGESGDRFVGGMIGKKSISDAVASFVNVGRLWQYCREQHRRLLDVFEKINVT